MMMAATSIAAPNISASTSSSFRASQNSGLPPQSENALTQLPRVDFNFEDLRQRMSTFTAKFDAFIEKGRKRVLEERNGFRGRLGELSGMFLLSRSGQSLGICGARSVCRSLLLAYSLEIVLEHLHVPPVDQRLPM
jgi:hypothetical protein